MVPPTVSLPKRLPVLLALALCLGGAASLRAAIRYVKPSATAGNGQSWATAYNSLSAALAAATPGTEIWVAAGTYTPAPAFGDPTAAFVLKGGVALYGGFAGTETARAQRRPAVNSTILSGDLNGDDGPYFSNTDENSYHVVLAAGVDATAVLDGFTIRGGNANGAPNDNRGGGMVIMGGHPTINGCTFTANSAIDFGGAIYTEADSPVLTACTFTGNQADEGGAVYNKGTASAAPVAASCVFSGNTALWMGGGAWYNDGASAPAILNCTFYGNAAAAGTGAGGAIYAKGGSPAVTNCILWANTSGVGTAAVGPVVVRSCDLQDGLGPNGPGQNGNISVDPMFANAAGGDFHLSLLSPCVDAGLNATVRSIAAAAVTVDMDGNPRVADGNGDGAAIVDIGAYEVPGLSILDAARALRIADGVLKATSDDMLRLNVVTSGLSARRIDVTDACMIARRIAGKGTIYSVADAARALEIAGGLRQPSEADMLRFDLDTAGTGKGRITLTDATLVARRAALAR